MDTEAAAGGKVAVNLQSFPPWVVEKLAMETLAMYRRILLQPGGQAMIDAKVEQMRREAAQKGEQ